MTTEKNETELSAEELDEVSGGTGMHQLRKPVAMGIGNKLERTMEVDAPVAQVATGVSTKLKPQLDMKIEQDRGLGGTDLAKKPGPGGKPQAK